jgi:hypothetical protein
MERTMLTLKDLKNLDGDALLETVGLQRRATNGWVAPAVAGAAVGLLVGAACALLLTPRSGQELRSEVRRRFAGESDQNGVEDFDVPPSVGSMGPQSQADRPR